MLDSVSSSACSSPGWEHYVVTLATTVYCDSVSLQMGTVNAGGNAVMD